MDIKLIQNKLNSFPYTKPKLDEDGLLGPATVKAIRQFQRNNSLAPDGVLGQITIKALNLPLSPIILQGKYDIQPFPKDASLSLNELSLQIALAQEGVRELTGHNDGPAVETFLSSVSLEKGQSWCMSFQYWATNEAAKIKNIINPLVKTGGCLYQWQYTKCKKLISSPKRGDIFIIDEGRNLGHTGRIIEVNANLLSTIEGNTNDNGSREGIGVFKRTRDISKIKGFIRI